MVEMSVFNSIFTLIVVASFIGGGNLISCENHRLESFITSSYTKYKLLRNRTHRLLNQCNVLICKSVCPPHFLVYTKTTISKTVYFNAANILICSSIEDIE